ncbi:hypothetical protein GGQ64_003854 [Rhizobium azooxidifex]|uniref:Uncharacterized protein n=1 Tax=Mycoplana azooxidifex TaxID=1636188 RepID=A0A7W6GM62_9HYPH|nr:hypothetical protein [Mycoplana azooxidifex]MBB3978619.1 hypothetical protein [Mycoplana azooxidifex]
MKIGWKIIACLATLCGATSVYARNPVYAIPGMVATYDANLRRENPPELLRKLGGGKMLWFASTGDIGTGARFSMSQLSATPIENSDVASMPESVIAELMSKLRPEIGRWFNQIGYEMSGDLKSFRKTTAHGVNLVGYSAQATKSFTAYEGWPTVSCKTALVWNLADTISVTGCWDEPYRDYGLIEFDKILDSITFVDFH